MNWSEVTYTRVKGYRCLIEDDGSCFGWVVWDEEWVALARGWEPTHLDAGLAVAAWLASKGANDEVR